MRYRIIKYTEPRMRLVTKEVEINFPKFINIYTKSYEHSLENNISGLINETTLINVNNLCDIVNVYTRNKISCKIITFDKGNPTPDFLEVAPVALEDFVENKHSEEDKYQYLEWLEEFHNRIKDHINILEEFVTDTGDNNE